MFVYQAMINGGWATVSRDTFHYLDPTYRRRRFFPFVWVKRLYKKL